MRYRILRFDIWFCLLIGFLVSFGTESLVTKLRTAQYEDHKAEHIVPAGEIGGPATDETFRAESIDDLLSHDTFTVISPGIEYRNRGSGYYHGMYLDSLTLPSGERVAARIKYQNVTKVNPENDYFTGDSILPIGQIVTANLEDDEYFLQQIEFKEPLSRHDFYIDMVGGGTIMSEEDFIEAPVLFAQLLTVIIVFAILHLIGSKIGIFPAFYTRKRSEAGKKSDWD